MTPRFWPGHRVGWRCHAQTGVPTPLVQPSQKGPVFVSSGGRRRGVGRIPDADRVMPPPPTSPPKGRRSAPARAPSGFKAVGGFCPQGRGSAPSRLNFPRRLGDPRRPPRPLPPLNPLKGSWDPAPRQTPDCRPTDFLPRVGSRASRAAARTWVAPGFTHPAAK